MQKRRAALRRSATEWAIRGLLALGAAALAVASLRQTSALLIRQNDPARAHALAPQDGRLTGLLAQSLSVAEATAAQRDRAEVLARRALLQDPTSVDAVATLGIGAQIKGDTKRARRLYAYAQELSRRHLSTQLWAIEDAVSRGDVAAAIGHYDIALRTNRQAPELLFPILVGSLAEPSIRAALARTLAARPVWGASFIEYAAASGTDPKAVAAFFRLLGESGTTVRGNAQAQLINTLLSRNLPEEAWRYYVFLHPGADRRMSRDPFFRSPVSDPSLFDWLPVNDAGISASIQHDNGGNFLDFAAPPSVGGPIVQQTQLLPPGVYRLEGRSENIEQPAETSPFWTLTCPDGRQLGRVPVPNSAQNKGMFSGSLSIPADCPRQTLVLMAQPSDAASGLSGQIKDVRLRPTS
jgi:tetratricopeptide (TPR) repeat protein